MSPLFDPQPAFSPAIQSKICHFVYIVKDVLSCVYFLSSFWTGFRSYQNSLNPSQWHTVFYDVMLVTILLMGNCNIIDFKFGLQQQQSF